ncbi:hypothetical protein HDV00_007222 [Rhizophlyctis rosea]|nr:hypothetical protein HDV00_007222 [Rhizophlyctis rosea]
MQFKTITAASLLVLAGSVAAQNTTAQTDCGEFQSGQSPLVQCKIDPKNPIPSAPCSCDEAKLVIVNPYVACLNNMFNKKPDATASDYDRMLLGLNDMCAGIKAANNGTIPASTGNSTGTSNSTTPSGASNSSTTTRSSSATASPTAAGSSGAVEGMKVSIGAVAVLLAGVVASLM